MPGRDRRKGLHDADHHGVEKEETETHPDGRDAQKIEVPATGSRCRAVVSRGLLDSFYVERQGRAVEPQHQQHAQGQHTGCGQRHAPGGGDGNRHDESRSQCPTQAPGDAMHAVGVAEPRRRHLAIEQRVVDRVEHAVADACNHRADQEHPVTLRRCVAEGRDSQHAQPDEQHRSWAQLVDDEA